MRTGWPGFGGPVHQSGSGDSAAPAMRIVVNLPDDLLLKITKPDRLADILALWNTATFLDPLDIALSAPAPRGLNSLVCMPKLWRLLANVTPRSVVRGRIKGRIEWSFVDARTIIGSMIASFQHRPIPPTCPACQARMKLVLVGGVEPRACKCQDCARQDRNAA